MSKQNRLRKEEVFVIFVTAINFNLLLTKTVLKTRSNATFNMKEVDL